MLYYVFMTLNKEINYTEKQTLGVCVGGEEGWAGRPLAGSVDALPASSSNFTLIHSISPTFALGKVSDSGLEVRDLFYIFTCTGVPLVSLFLSSQPLIALLSPLLRL